MKLAVKIFFAALLAVGVAALPAAAKSKKVAWLGVYTQTVDDDMADGFKLSVDHGAIVNEVVRNSPAAEAGIEENDIIISFDANKVWDADELTDLIQEHQPGDQVTLKVLRGKDEKEFTVTLDARRASSWNLDWAVPSVPPVPGVPSVPRTPRAPMAFNFDNYGRHVYVGIEMQSLNEQLGAFFGVKDGDGVLISKVEEDSPAEKAGLKAGDVIVAVDSEQIDGTDDVSEILADKDAGDQVAFSLVREKKPVSVTVEVGERNEYTHWGQMAVPDLGDVQFYHPRTRGLSRGNSSGLMYDEDDRRAYDDAMRQYKRSMEEYQEQMTDLRRELNELKKKVEDQ